MMLLQIDYTLLKCFIQNLNIIFMDSQSNFATSLSSNEEPEIFIQNSDGSQDDLFFDQIVGALQSSVLEPNFMLIQQNFMRAHCNIFEDKEENKMEYMAIFNEYQSVIEKYILNSLKEKIEAFSMETFSHLLSTRNDQIDEDLLEMLNSFADFEIFKQLMLEHKKYYSQEIKYGGLCIKGAVCKL